MADLTELRARFGEAEWEHNEATKKLKAAESRLEVHQNLRTTEDQAAAAVALSRAESVLYEAKMALYAAEEDCEGVSNG